MSRHWILHISIQITLLYVLIQIYLIFNNTLFTNYINTFSYNSTNEVSYVCFGILGILNILL